MNKAFIMAQRAEFAKRNEVSTGSVLMDRAFKVPMRSCLLLNGTSGVGTTSVALSLSLQLSLTRPVIYFDIFQSLNHIRVKNIENLIVAFPWGFEPISLIETIEEFGDEEIVLVFDHFEFLEKLWSKIGWSFEEVLRRLRFINPKITIIGTQRHKSISQFWNNIVTIRHDQNIYQENDYGENDLMGHMVSIIGDEGTTRVYIDHQTGTVSKAFEQVKLSIESDEKTRNSIFEKGLIRVQGSWNFIHEVGKQERNEI